MKTFDVYPLYNVTITKGEGSYVWDDNNQKYLDMYGGHAVISIGHTNPRYVAALIGQLSNIGFYSNSVHIPIQNELCEKLTKVIGKEDYQLFLCNSGAEANENALKLASFHTGRKKVIAFSGAFHGRTSLAVSCTANPKIIAPVNETDNVVFLPYNDVEALTAYFEANGSEVAAVITEGIQGVAGITVATKEFLVAIRTLCDKFGAVYIADSVQCGCGRTGTYFSHDYAGVEADIYSMAKGIGNGFPMGATLISPKIAPKYGMLGTTFGGNHLACAAAIAVAEEIAENNLIENVNTIGNYLMEELLKIEGIKLRGRGLMIGIDLGYDSGEFRKKLLYDEKVFVGSAGDKNVIRLLPALNITKEHADLFLEAFKRVLCKK
ncbi:MAG: aminotransferase class III-fold pyridoxal phosphate-dependent enzyme [Rikenellaceae bacterium]